MTDRDNQFWRTETISINYTNFGTCCWKSQSQSDHPIYSPESAVSTDAICILIQILFKFQTKNFVDCLICLSLHNAGFCGRYLYKIFILKWAHLHSTNYQNTSSFTGFLLLYIAHNWVSAVSAFLAPSIRHSIFSLFWSTPQASVNNFAWPLLKAEYYLAIRSGDPFGDWDSVIYCKL